MDTQWWLPGLALAAVTLAVAALVPPGRGLSGNLAWSALGWLASEFAPWLAVLLLVAGVALGLTLTWSEVESSRLAALLALAALAGLVSSHVRARRARAVLEAALREELGRTYAGDLAPARRAVVCGRPRHGQALRPVPHRRAAIVECIPDVPYPGGDERNRLDVYRPAAGCQGAPILLQIHGGNWVAGDRRQQALPLMHHLAALGWLVVAANYRLGPAARLPAHLIDCKSALAWIRGHAAALGGDPHFVAVTGGGAGAHLASLIALTFDQRDLQPGFEQVDTRPAACVALHGVYDLADRWQHFAGRQARLRWLGNNVMCTPAERDPGGWDLVSPIARVRQDAPPFFVLHGTHDALSPVAGAREFVARLRDVSCSPVVYGELPGAHHGFDTAVTHRSLQTVHAVARFLEWCAAAHYRARGPQHDSADRARS